MAGRGKFFIYKTNVMDIHDNLFEIKVLSCGCLLRFESLILNNLELSINITVGDVYYLNIWRRLSKGCSDGWAFKHSSDVR